METTLPAKNRYTMDRHEFFRLVGTSIGTILLTRCSAGCSTKASNEPDPNQPKAIDFTINLADQANENLAEKGGYLLINTVIVAQTKTGQFVAVSAKCTHQGTELVYKSAENQFYCPLHLSRFDTTGKVLIGPAVQPLTRYTVENLSSTVLRIYG